MRADRRPFATTGAAHVVPANDFERRPTAALDETGEQMFPVSRPTWTAPQLALAVTQIRVALAFEARLDLFDDRGFDQTQFGLVDSKPLRWRFLRLTATVPRPVCVPFLGSVVDHHAAVSRSM